jgi:hypothetical protein
MPSPVMPDNAWGQIMLRLDSHEDCAAASDIHLSERRVPCWAHHVPAIRTVPSKLSLAQASADHL